MSRVRPIPYQDSVHWFDTRKNSQQATPGQLAMLADVEGIDLDDLLDESLIQIQVMNRLRERLDPGSIPAEVLERRRARRALSVEKDCRVCPLDGENCEGEITRHHFVPRWMMLELQNYTSYAQRSRCTIPICLGRHRDLHARSESPKSLFRYMRQYEKLFAEKMLNELREERPRIYDLIAAGDFSHYETQLLNDHLRGEFRRA